MLNILEKAVDVDTQYVLVPRVPRKYMVTAGHEGIVDHMDNDCDLSDRSTRAMITSIYSSMIESFLHAPEGNQINQNKSTIAKESEPLSLAEIYIGLAMLGAFLIGLIGGAIIH